MPRHTKKRATRRKTSRKYLLRKAKTMRRSRRGGGDNGIKSFFQEATDASCVLIPKSASRSK